MVTLAVTLLRQNARRLALGFGVVALIAGCAAGDEAPVVVAPSSSSPTTAPPATTTTTLPPATTTTTAGPAPLVPGVHVDWAAIDPAGEAKAVVTPTGIVLPVVGLDGDRYVVTTPCAQQATVSGTPLTGANVVIDAGHGGDEPGAVGRVHGLTEKEVNLAIAEQTKQLLEEAGATVVLTRTADYRITLATRGALATALAPQAFVSIHHNAEPDGPWDGPGNETYYQIASPDSKRLAGLVWEEIHEAFAPFAVSWVADTDAGAKYRLASSGGDYYGILKRTAGVAAVLSEAAFISNPPEEELLLTDDFRHAEALAIARAVVRYLGTPDQGSGYTTPYDRTEPAGGGGGTSGCEDPALE